MPVLALAGGSLAFLVFIVLLIAAIVLTLYSRRGSGITERPSDGRGGAPGADGSSEIAGDHTEGAPPDRGTE